MWFAKRLPVIWIKRLVMVSCLALIPQSGWQERKPDGQVPPKREQATATVHLPPQLLTAITANFPTYHVPAGTDLRGQWARAVKTGTPPFICEGDFNGDGLTDVAVILVGNKEWK